MVQSVESSDVGLLGLLHQADSLGIAELARLMGVTATAVRQRLNRLMGEGLIQRTLGRADKRADRSEPADCRDEENRAGRGRPSHLYSLTDQGRRKMGVNFADLAVVMWKEIRAVKDPEIRRGLLERLARSMADLYGSRVTGQSAAERMQAISELFRERNVPFSVDTSGRLPVLVAEACPYPGLPEQDRSICTMEKMMLSKLLGQGVRLSGCRLDGTHCCTFETT